MTNNTCAFMAADKQEELQELASRVIEEASGILPTSTGELARMVTMDITEDDYQATSYLLKRLGIFLPTFMVRQVAKNVLTELQVPTPVVSSDED